MTTLYKDMETEKSRVLISDIVGANKQIFYTVVHLEPTGDTQSSSCINLSLSITATS